MSTRNASIALYQLVSLPRTSVANDFFLFNEKLEFIVGIHTKAEIRSDGKGYAKFGLFGLFRDNGE